MGCVGAEQERESVSDLGRYEKAIDCYKQALTIRRLMSQDGMKCIGGDGEGIITVLLRQPRKVAPDRRDESGHSSAVSVEIPRKLLK